MSILLLGLCCIQVQAITYQPVDYSAFHNYRLQSINSVFPSGNLTLGGVPFNIPVTGNNIWACNNNSDDAPRYIDINVWASNVTEVDTIINVVWGRPGPNSYASIEFFGSNGAYYKKDLVGNVDIRDHYNGVYTNSINNTTTTNVFSANNYRLDKQEFDLPAEFASQVLSRIRISDYGKVNFQRLLVAGVTLGIADSASPAPFDLAIAPQDISVSPSSPIMAGTAAQVSATIHNLSDTQGTADIHFTATDGNNIMDLGTAAGVSIPAQGTATASITHNTGGLNGTFKYTAAIINPSEAEFSTSNNSATSSGAIITNVIPVYYGYNPNTSGSLILVGFTDNTNYSVVSLDPPTSIVRTGTLNKAQSAGISISNIRHFKVEADKPIFAYLGYDCCSYGGSFFFPAIDGANRVGTDYTVLIPVLSGTNEFVIWAYDDAEVTISRPDSANPNKLIPVVGPFRLAKNTRWETTGGPISANTLYYIHSEPPASNPTSSARIALECNTGNGQASIPSSNGRDMGMDFLFKTHNWGGGAIAVFAYEDTDVTCTRVSDNAAIFTKSILKGQTYFQQGCGRNPFHLTSSRNVAVWAGDYEGGSSIADMGDDITINQGNGGKEFYLHSQTQGAFIFCAYDNTIVTATNVANNTTTTYTRDRDGFINIASGQVLHIVATNPVMVQTLGGNGFNDWGNALNPVFGLDSGCAFPPSPDAGPDRTVVRGRNISFDASLSSGDIISYQWDFNGDGVPDSTSAKPAFTFDNITQPDQPIQVKLTVSDSKGCQASDTALITVRDPIPFDLSVTPSDISATPSGPVKGGTPVHISATIRNTSDFDGSCEVLFAGNDGTNTTNISTVTGVAVPAQSSAVVSTDFATTGQNGTFIFSSTIQNANSAESSAVNNSASTTGIIIDSTAPSVVLTGDPAEGAATTPSPAFTWSGSDNLTGEASLVYSYKLDSAEWSAYSSETSFSFASLAAGAHTFSVKAKDLASNESSEVIRNFTVDTVAPTVTSVSPADAAKDVAAETTITANFSEAMKASTINSASFTLKDVGGNSVAGAVTYDSATKTATFKPSAALASYTGYVATISAEAADVAGNPLQSSYSWGFTTLQIRQFNVCDGVVTSVQEEPDPGFFTAINNSLLRPKGWTFANPHKNVSSSYGWKTNLSALSLQELLDYNLVFMANHTNTNYSAEDSQKIREWVNAGGTMWIDDCGGMRISGFFVPFNFASYDGWPNSDYKATDFPDHPFFSGIYKLNPTEISRIGHDGYSGHVISHDPTQWTELLYNRYYGSGQRLPDMLLMNYGKGRIIVTSDDYGCGIEDYGGQGGAYDSGDLKMVYNILNWAQDTLPPQVTLTSGPAEGDTVCSLPVIFNWVASDDYTPIDQMKFTWKTDESQASTPSADTSCTLSQIADGDHTLEVVALDLAGNPSLVPAVRHFKVDTTAPVISNASALPETLKCTITWQTDEPATTQIDWGTTDACGIIIPHTGNPGANHSVTINGLRPGATYYYKITSADACGHEASTAVLSFATRADTTAPDTQITGGPSENGVSCTDTLSIGWTGSDNTTQPSDLQYSWKLDDAAEWSTPSAETSHEFAGLAEGPHTINVRAYDAFGNIDDTPAMRHFNVDLSDPVISTISANPQVTQATITWKTSKPATSQIAYGASEYTLSTSADTRMVTDHSVTITGLGIASSYHFCVKSKDSCGREAVSEDQAFTTLPDTTAPDTQFTSGPADGAVVCANNTRFCWIGGDNATPVSSLLYSYKLDNGTWSTPGAATCFDLASLTEGIHSFSVKASDSSGNVDATSAVRSFKIDLSDPAISNVSSTTQPTAAAIVWLTDKPATSLVEYSTDTSYSLKSPLNSALVTGHSMTLSGLDAAATYHYRIKSKDVCGREVTSGDFSFTTDPDAATPDTVISSGPGEGAAICDPSVVFSFSGTDDTTHVSKLRYAYRIDGGVWSDFTLATTANLTGLTAGTHTFEVAAKDSFDKVDPTPAVRHFIANLDPPVISAVSSAPSRGDATISWTTDEPATSQVDYGTDKGYGSDTPLNSGLTTKHTVAITGLAASTTYHFSVKSKDSCGRESVSDDFAFTTQADDGTPDTWVTTNSPSEGGSSCSTTVSLSWTGKDDVTSAASLSFSWKIDGSEWSAYTSETSHVFTGLAEGSHTFYVRAKDASANIDPTAAMRHFAVDLTSPTASNIAASPEATRATINWLTSKPATSQVEFGATNSYGSITAVDRSLTNSHSVSIASLAPETTYHYRVRSKDICEREVISDDFTFRTPADTNIPDTRIISGPDEGGKACEGAAQLCWSGSDDATSVVSLLYSYKMDDAAWSDWTADTCNMFTGLAAGLHTLQVKAKDTAGNIDATPAVRNFKVDLSTPSISNVLVVPRQSSVTVSWITSEPTTSQLEYGAAISYGSKTSVDNNMVTGHKMTISGLTPETAYHVRVRSSDGCRETVGDDNTFTTLTVQPPNLMPMGIMSPPSTSAMAALQVTYTVKNTESGDAPTAWMDGFYLSEDENFDADKDIPLGQFPSPGALTGLFSYSQAVNLTMPKVAPGVYYILLKVDDGDIINETTKGDNLFAQPINVTLVKQLTVTPGVVWLQLNPASPVTGQLDISNLGIDDLSDLKAAVSDAAANIDIKLDLPPTLEALTTKKVNYTITASDESVLQNSPVVDITAGSATASVKFNLYVVPRQPKLIANPGYMEAGMVRGKQAIVECEVTNTGAIPANDVKVKIPAVPWLSLISPADLGSIAPGEKVKVALALNPSATEALGPHNGNIALTASNGGVSVSFSFNCTSDGLGDLKVICQDEFSFFADDHPNLADAVITLTDALTGAKVFEAMTDTTGIYTKTAIKEGHYNLEVKAYKHASYHASLEIVAGQTKEISAFMQRQFVTYTWNVEPVQLEDKYKISIEAVFETHVPAPVVTVDPPYSLVPVLEGKTTEVLYTITNHGLVAAQGVQVDFPENDTYQVVPLIRDIGVLPAESSIVVPVLIRAKKDGPIEMLPQVAQASQARQEAKMAAAQAGDSGTGITSPIPAPDGNLRALEAGGDDPMKKCDLTIKGKVLYYYVCVNEKWQAKSIDSTPLYIGKEIWDILKCGFDALACAASFETGGVSAVKCPDAVRCMFKYLCAVISAYGGTPCCYCKMVSSLLGDTGEMGDAFKCLPKPKIDLSVPPRRDDGPTWGIGLNLPSNGFDVAVGDPWDFGEGIPGPCQGIPKPSTSSSTSAGVNAAAQTQGTDISKYGGKEVRCKIRCY